MRPTPGSNCAQWRRRDFLTIGSAGLLGLCLPDVLRLEAKADSSRTRPSGPRARADAAILVWLSGGPSALDMWDLKPESPSEIRGEFRPIGTTTKGLSISEHLPQMAGLADRITVIRSLYHSIPAHEPATVLMTTGNVPTPALKYPSLGSLAARLLRNEPGVPPYVTFRDLRGEGAGEGGYLGAAYNPFLSEERPARGRKGKAQQPRGVGLPATFSLKELESREAVLRALDDGFRAADRSADGLDSLDAFHIRALDILRANKTKTALDLERESRPTRERYGKSRFARAALTARRLVEAGVRFVTIGMGDWDTHSGNFATLKKRLLPELDQTLSALIRDLDERGLLDRTIVYCAGEFSRTPKINANAGRDHWARSTAAVLAGGGFRRGYVHGSTDGQGSAPAFDPCTPDDLAATLFDCLGFPPHHELITPGGRRIPLFAEGKLIAKVLA